MFNVSVAVVVGFCCVLLFLLSFSGQLVILCCLGAVKCIHTDTMCMAIVFHLCRPARALRITAFDCFCSLLSAVLMLHGTLLQHVALLGHCPFRHMF